MLNEQQVAMIINPQSFLYPGPHPILDDDMLRGSYFFAATSLMYYDMVEEAMTGQGLF